MYSNTGSSGDDVDVGSEDIEVQNHKVRVS